MIVFERNQTLTKNDLNIFVRDDEGDLFDPSSITYTIFDKTGSTPVLVGGNLNQVPTRVSVGFYFANITLTETDNLGEYEIHWNFKKSEDSNNELVKQRFSIVKKKEPLSFLNSIGGVAYAPGQILGPDELFINLLNKRNNPFDPDRITYAIFDRTTGLDILIGSPANEPVRVHTGRYYANFQIPDSANEGDYIIRWAVRDKPDEVNRTVVQEFAVVSGTTQVNSIFTDGERNMIRKLRFILRDNNPDRNYRFCPPESERVIQNFSETFGFIWTDEELFEYLNCAVDAINNYPPLEGWNLTTIAGGVDNFGGLTSLVVIKAAVFALMSLSINWIHDEFDYSIGGVSLNIDKSSKYQGASDKYNDEYQTALERYKDFGIKIAVGLQQPRFGIGVNSALGPFSGRGVQNRRNFIGSSRI